MQTTVELWALEKTRNEMAFVPYVDAVSAVFARRSRAALCGEPTCGFFSAITPKPTTKFRNATRRRCRVVNKRTPIKTPLIITAMMSASEEEARSVEATPEAPAEVRMMAKKLGSELASMFVEGMPVCTVELYAPDVEFKDPLNKFTGVRKYQSNIEFLKKSPVFDQTQISVHSINIVHRADAPTSARKWAVQTRWTLQMRMIAMPWRPHVLWTGTSDYVLDADRGYVVCEHIDKWDSLSGEKQQQEPVSFEGVKDLFGMIFRFEGATVNKGISQPTYSVIRRAREYEIRKYDAFYTAQVAYQTRPEGLSRLDAYYGGANDLGVAIPRTVPLLLEFARGFEDNSNKVMCGILPALSSSSARAPPSPTAPWIELRGRPSTKIAAITFGGNLTPDVAAYQYQLLLEALQRDGITRAGSQKSVTLAQYSAVYTVPWQKKHEVWVQVE